MSKYNLNAYILQQYAKNTGNKRAILVLEESYIGLIHTVEIGSITLDEDDIKYLLEKYEISELEKKEIEYEIAFKKLSNIQDEIKFLKSNQTIKYTIIK